MKKTLRVTIDIEVSDLSDAEREQLAKDAEQDVSELGTLADYAPGSLANLLDCLSGEGTNELVFEGTDIFAKFTDTEIISAAFIDKEFK